MRFVSVVIANWNGRHLLEQSLPSVLAALREGDEVIIVDNGSQDDSVDFLLKHFPSVRLICLPKNYGFSIANNLGVLVAKNDIVVLLNNDMQPEADFLEPLLGHFDDPKVFAVGCKLLHPDGSPDHANRTRLIVSGGFLSITSERDAKRLSQITQPEEQVYAQGGGAAFDRHKFLELGGFDPIFSPAYFEDVDLSLRALQKGWRIIYEPRSIVWHLGAQTSRAKARWFLELVAFRNFWLCNLLSTPNLTWAGWQVADLIRLLLTEALFDKFLTYHLSAIMLLTKWWGVIKRRWAKPPMTTKQLVKLLNLTSNESGEPNGQMDSLPEYPFVLLLAPAYEGDKTVLQAAANAARQRWNFPVAIIARPSQTVFIKHNGIADLVIPFLRDSSLTPFRNFTQLAVWLTKSNCQAMVIPSQIRSPSKGKFIFLGFIAGLLGRKSLWEWDGRSWKRYSALRVLSVAGRFIVLLTALPLYFLLTIAFLSSVLIPDFARLTLKPRRTVP